MARRRKNKGNERDKKKNINKQGEDERKVKTLNEEKKRNVKNEAAARLKQTNKQNQKERQQEKKRPGKVPEGKLETRKDSLIIMNVTIRRREGFDYRET